MIEIHPQEAALVVVDPQNAFCHRDGTLGQSGVDITSMAAVIPPLREIVELCRSVGIPDIWTRQIHYPSDRTRAGHRIKPHTLKRARVACQPGSWDAAIVDELADLIGPDTPVLDKHRWSAFYGTRLDVLLRTFGTRLVIVVGTTTNACIDTTVRDAYVRDYDVVVVEDGVAGVRPDWHRMALEVLGHYACQVVSLTELREALAAAEKVA